MTHLPRLSLALGLAVGLAAAPSAQQLYPDDADHPGTPVVDVPPTGARDVDDRDPGSHYVEPPSNGLGDVDDRDRPFSATTLTPRATLAFVNTGPLDDGRTAEPGAFRPRPVQTAGLLDVRTAAELLDGRTPETVRVAAERRTVAYTGPLDDGRPEGARRAVVLEADDAVASFETADVAAEAADGLTLEAVHPNPAADRATLAFSVEDRARATVTVYDVRGRVVAVAFDDVAAPGVALRATFDATAVAPGTYVAVLAVGDQRLSRTFQVVR